MNNVFKTAIKFYGIRALLTSGRNARWNPVQTQLTRNLWYLNDQSKLHCSHNVLCGCGCRSSRNAHTKAERELVEFLTEEVVAERKAQKLKTIPTELDGFKAGLNGAEVTLTKQADGETVKISFNVNHSVDTDEPEVHENSDKADVGELKSKPAFKIDLVRGDTTVSVLCSFVNAGEEDGYNDSFGIDEISIYNGEWNEHVYSVSGEVLDSYLYDLILNYLEEKGITNEFVEKLSNYSTAYEHSAYISLLESLSKFVSGK
ncbi:complement component 1 Q subcomponent-binding protein, mitochondrial [Cylas formicarius]|uniref:complement component 1 Q subcomponent-binding protein, mitochondrial n=1 Tax=Cylas formicarius TaxID=197179 RepID=UPI002958497B|nr:complement component 1 Q subcomponent-binding protein, mitochondrial [Cylas formicarius]